ncbi:hypothetical protein [Nocardioides alcanivorans]|uniref:hypothetical protein n=1 Tax=Nocardioides alcanivorans TaxID=2897352 RepID=UPI001F3612BA|nr:hypothetical protein [Nocardioides alcanivorans]
MEAAPVASDELEVSRRRWWRWLWIPVLAVVVGAAWWWAFHPTGLPTSDAVVTATVKSGQTVYLGVPSGETKARTLSLHSVEASSDGGEVTFWVCHGGSISSTTRPEPFCADWTGAKDAELKLADGDQLVVAVTSDSPASWPSAGSRSTSATDSSVAPATSGRPTRLSSLADP